MDRMRMENMTLREKVGQLFIIRPEALEQRFLVAQLEDIGAAGATEVTEGMEASYSRYPCGGFALFGKNILSPKQLKMFTEKLHALGTIRPVLAVDEEGGRVARLANHPSNFGVRKTPSMEALAKTKDPEKAYEAGRTIGAYLTEYGFEIDFAPVADINTNPRNTVIGDRAFGSDPELAARMVASYVEGLHASGLAACLKHFPGHGDTATDSHTGYAETGRDWETIRNCEMIPFRAGIEAGTDLVMTAHVAVPNVTGSETPSTMSGMMLTEKLRGELGYKGLIITDALGMGAIREKYSSAEACIACMQAGVDILLMPYDYFEAFDGVVQAVENGLLPESRIDESVERILRFKMKYARHI